MGTNLTKKNFKNISILVSPLMEHYMDTISYQPHFQEKIYNGRINFIWFKPYPPPPHPTHTHIKHNIR